MREQWNVAGRRVVITGATRGIGLAAAQALAAHGAELSLVARDEERAAAAVRRIGADVEVHLCDLSLQRSVRELAHGLLARHGRIDVLVNNAGAMYSRRQLTGEGVERTWALNHLAPFLLTALLLERLKASAPARIVTTSSGAHTGATIPFDDLGAERSYRGYRRYSQTKLANILFTTELARRLHGSGVTANCFHPGLVATGFNRNNGALNGAAMTVLRPISRDPEHGARTLVWLVASPAVSEESGGYFMDERRATPSAAARDEDAARRLWELSESALTLR